MEGGEGVLGWVMKSAESGVLVFALCRITQIRRVLYTIWYIDAQDKVVARTLLPMSRIRMTRWGERSVWVCQERI
jgi:hypothetical protein